jgi:hypothetical protein
VFMPQFSLLGKYGSETNCRWRTPRDRRRLQGNWKVLVALPGISSRHSPDFPIIMRKPAPVKDPSHKIER